MLLTCVACLFAGGLWNTMVSAEDIKFESQTIDPRPGKVVYAVTATDVNEDGRIDLVALTETQVVYYASPNWEKHVLIDGITTADNVCIAAQDIDGDLHVDFAIGAGWPRSGGTIQWIHRGESPEDPWQIHPIAEIPSTHRMRWANVLGREDRVEQLVVSPLLAGDGQTGAPLTAFEIPADPINDRWPSTLLSGNLNRVHNHWCVQGKELGWKRPEVKEWITLTASASGVHLIQPAGEADEREDVEAVGDGFVQRQLIVGATGDKPEETGCGEVKTGGLANGTEFIATIEPMHGTHAVVYLFDRGRSTKSDRVVLTDKLRGGHALWCADLDKDGDDEVVVGYREPNPDVGILVFDRQPLGGWEEQVLDPNGVACEDLIIEDFDIDGKLDILAGGRSTHNLKLYLNRGPAKKHGE